MHHTAREDTPGEAAKDAAAEVFEKGALPKELWRRDETVDIEDEMKRALEQLLGRRRVQGDAVIEEAEECAEKQDLDLQVR